MTLTIAIITTAALAYAAALLWAGREYRRAPEPDLSQGETHR